MPTYKIFRLWYIAGQFAGCLHVVWQNAVITLFKGLCKEKVTPGRMENTHTKYKFAYVTTYLDSPQWVR